MLENKITLKANHIKKAAPNLLRQPSLYGCKASCGLLIVVVRTAVVLLSLFGAREQRFH